MRRQRLTGCLQAGREHVKVCQTVCDLQRMQAGHKHDRRVFHRPTPHALTRIHMRVGPACQRVGHQEIAIYLVGALRPWRGGAFLPSIYEFQSKHLQSVFRVFCIKTVPNRDSFKLCSSPKTTAFEEKSWSLSPATSHPRRRRNTSTSERSLTPHR